MADLGSLNLILGADLSPLEASLGRAESLVNQASDRMGRSFKPFKFKVEVGDLAVQLTQAEGVVDRSIRQVRSIVRQPIKFKVETGDLGVQLTEAEALVDRTVRNIKSMNRSIDLNINVRGLDDSKSMVARSIQQLQGLTGQVLTIQVDDTRLTELNRHLDSKQAHYKRVQSDFATPLKVLVDDSQLTALNQHLTATQRHLTSAIAQFSSNKITPTIDLTNLNLLDRRLATTVDNLHQTQAEFNRPIVAHVDDRQLLELEDALDRVEKPHKLRLDLPDTIGGLTSAIGKLALSPVTIPIKIAQNALEGAFRGISEGMGRELSRNFSKGFASSIEGFITKKTGMSTTEMGAQSGKYVATRGKIGAEYISQELGYKDGLRGVGNDLKAAGTSVDTVLKNPRRAVRKIENKLVEALEYYQEGETDKAMNVVTESFAPMGKLARRAVGVGIRAAAQPIRIRNRAMLKGKVSEAEELAKNIEIEGYDREAADKAEAIHIVTGGLDFNNGENAHFAGGLLKQQYPKAHTITHVNKAMNQPVQRGQGVVGGMMGMMEQLQKMGGKEGKIGDMPIQKLAEMAIDLGYNPDGLEMYAKAVKIRQAHPNKPINFMATSGGVDAVNYAVALSERAGMKNVKGVGLGLPMANLTELASKKNFQSIVGTLDDLDLAYHNEDHLGAKRLADPESMAKLRKTKAEKFPFDMSGIVSVGKTQKHIVDAGLGHAIGSTYLGSENVMSAMNDFIARPDSPYPHVRTDIKKSASLNNFYSEKFNAKRKEIPLTIAAMYKDPKALARIEADPLGKTGDYTYFSPANKNHKDDWLRTNEFDGLIKDVRGENIQGRSEEENAKSRKKGLNSFIEDHRRRAAKKGTTSVVAEHAAGWLDYLDTMKSGMEEYGKTGAMPYDALQKGAEYYPELRSLAAREQHKKEMVLSPYLTPSGVESEKRNLDKLYASGDINKINESRANHKLKPIDRKYGYQDALATPDWYLKDIDKQRADTAAEIARNQAEMQRLKNNPAAPSVPVTPIVDPVENERYRQEIAQRRANIAKEKERSKARSQPVNLSPSAQSQSQSELALINNSGSSIVPSRSAAARFVIDSAQIVATGVVKIGGNALTAVYGAEQALLGRGGAKVVNTLAASAAMSQLPGGAEAIGMVGHGISGLANMPLTHLAGQSSEAIGGFLTQALGNVPLLKSVVPQLTAQITEALAGGAVGMSGTIGSVLAPFVTGFAALKSAKVGVNLIAPGAIGNNQLAAGSEDFTLRVLRGIGNAARSTNKFVRRAALAPKDDVIDGELIETPILSQRKYRAIGSIPQRKEQRPILQIGGTERKALPASQFATNIASIDPSNPKLIQDEVKKISEHIRAKRELILSLLKSSDTNDIASGLQAAKVFNLDVGIAKTELQTILPNIVRAKQDILDKAKAEGVRYKKKGELPGYTNLESSRKTIEGVLKSDGIQTKSVDDAVKQFGNGSSSTGLNGFIGDMMRRNMGQGDREGGYSIEGGLIGQLAAGFKKFAQSPLGQKRVPGLDFLDRQINLPSKKTILGSIAGLGIAASSFLSPSSAIANTSTSSLSEQQISSQISQASIENGPRISDKESSEYNALLVKEQKKQQLTNLEKLKIKLYGLKTSNQITYPGYENDWVPGKKIRNIPSESPSIIHDAYNKQEEPSRKTGYKSDPLSAEEKLDRERLIDKYPSIPRSDFSNNYNAEQRKLYGYVQRDDLQAIKDRERTDPLTVSSLKVTPEAMAQLPDEYQKLEAIKSAARKRRSFQENKISGTPPARSIVQQSTTQPKSPQLLSKLDDQANEMMLWIAGIMAATLGGGVSAAKIIGSRSTRQEETGNEKSKSRQSKLSLPQIPKISLPELNIGDRIDQLQSSYADAQDQFRSITNGVVDRVKSSWQQYVDATKTRIEQFKSSAINAARSIKATTASNEKIAAPIPLSSLDPWNNEGRFPTPIPPKQSNPSPYPQQPDPWAKRPSNTHFPVDGQINIEQEKIKRNSQPKTPPTLPNGVTPPPPPKNPFIPPVEIEKSESALTKLTNVGKLALNVFGGFTLASLAVPAMIALGKSTIDTAANFETLQVKLAAASDSAQTGKQTFSRLTSAADKLGISRSSALETGAFIGGTTFGTELEGKPTDRMTSQILQIAQARGLNKQQTDGLNLALAQTLGRSRTSMQEINQLTQSAGITDARVIAAKGLGYTPQQFSAIQDSPTGIDSKRFVQAFLAQGVQDSLSAKDLAQSSIGFKQTKLDAGVERLQGNVGAGFSPVYKTGLDLLTGSIELLSLGIEKSSNLLIGIGLRLLYVGGTALLPIILNSKLAGIAVNGMIGAFSNLPQAGIAVAKLAGQFALMAVAGEVIAQVSKIWHNSSQEIEDAATKIGKAVDVINGKKVNPIGKPKTTDEIQGKDWGESAVLFGQRAFKGAAKKQSEIGDSIVDAPFSVGLRNMLGIKGDKNTYRAPLPVDSKEKEQSERTIAIDNVLGRSSQAISAVDAAVQKAQKLQTIDLEINQLDSQRSGLYANGEPDASKLANLNSRYNAKYQERDGATEGLTDTRNAIQEAINGIKGSKAKLTADFNEGQTLDDKGNVVGGNSQITIDNYNRGMGVLDAKLQDAEQAQRKLNDAIKSGFDNLLPWTTSLDKIVASFDDIKTKAEESAQKLSIGRNNLERGGKLTKGEAEYQGSIDKQSNIQTQIKQTTATIKELRAALLTKDAKAIENVQKNYGVDDSTSGTQLRLKADKATSAVDKEILSKLAIIKDKEINLTGLQSQFSDARTEMYRRIEQENRDAMLYYVSLAKQIDPQGMAFTKAIAQITQDKNKLLSKLNGYGNGMFDSFVGSVLELFDSSKRKLDAMAAYATARKNAFDNYQDRNYQAETTNRNSFNAPGTQNAAPSNYPTEQASSTSTPASTRTVRSDDRDRIAPPEGARTSSQTKPSQSKPIPPKTTKNLDPNGYLRSSNGTQVQVDTALRQLTPEQRDRYLNTPMSIDGKTNLGLDEYDRKVLGLRDRPKTPTRTVRSSSEGAPARSPEPGRSQSQQPPNRSTIQPNYTPKSGEIGRIQGDKLKTYAENSQTASQKILQQDLDRAGNQRDTAFSDDAYQRIVNEQKARRETRLKEQENRRTIRDQQRSITQLKPTLTIQEKQSRELETFNNGATDSKETMGNFRTNLSESTGDIRQLIQYMQGKQGLSETEKQTLTPEQQIATIAARKKALAETIALEKRLSGTLKTVDTNFSQIDNKIKEARERIAEQQKYDNSVAVEQTGIRERETKRTGIEAERTGVQQQLKTQQFNTGLNATDRQLEEDSAIIAIQNEEIQALRALTEKERDGTLSIGRNPAQVKAYIVGQQAKIRGTYTKKRQDVKQNRSQRSTDTQFAQDTELRSLNINQNALDTANEGITDRIQTVTDHTDSPFANNISIDRELAKKLKVISDEQAVRDKKFLEDKKKYTGNDKLLGQIDRQYQAANSQSERQKEVATLESGVATTDRESSRRGYLYGQQKATFGSGMAIYTAQIQQQKLLGQDTREQDYQSQVLTKKAEYSQQKFDLNQQRAQITALTPEADAARASIDGLLKNLQTLETIELSNLSAQFNQLNQVIGETQKSTSDVFKSYLAGGAFDFKKLLSSPFLAFGNQMIDKLVPDLFSGLYQKSPQGAGSQPQKTGDVFSGLLNGLFGIGGGSAAAAAPVTPLTPQQSPATASTVTPVSTPQPIPPIAPAAQPIAPVSIPQLNPPTAPQPIPPNAKRATKAVAPVPLPEAFTVPPMPKDQFEGMPEKLIRTEMPGGYIEMPAQQTNNLLGLSSQKLETDIPVLTSSIDNLTAAITNSSIALDPQTDGYDLSFPDAGSPESNSKSNSLVGSSLLGGLTGLLGKGQSSTTKTLLSAATPLLGGLFSSLFGGGSGVAAYATGGIKGGLAPINNGIIGSGRSQIDNRLALVEDGEGVLTHLGVDTIGGASGLAKINRGIKIPMFANGGVKGANYASPRPNTSTPNIGNRSANLNNVSANVTINNSDGKSSVSTKEDGSKLSSLINNAISQALIREQRAGGLLYS
jgi:hypothetical protein